jgi:hypothetical protein
LLAQAQGREGRQGGRGGQEAARPPATDKVTPEIPGVVKAGTKIEIVTSDSAAPMAGVGLPDGSFIATGNGGVIKIDADGRMTTLVDDSGQAAGLAMDRKAVSSGRSTPRKSA